MGILGQVVSADLGIGGNRARDENQQDQRDK